MNAPKDTFWTPEHTAVVLEEYPTGKSPRAIAEGLGCTRNMIIGKARRLGLSTPVVRSAITADKPIVHRSAPFNPPSPDKPQAAPVVNSVDNPQSWKGLLDTQAGECLWPFNNPRGKHPEYLFCSAPVKGGYSYCPYHCAVAYTAGSYRPVYVPGSGR